MIKISPSLLASNFSILSKEIKDIEDSGADMLHIDVMDGVFVPNISFGMPILSAVRKKTDLVLDVHLMIIDPDKYIDEFIKCGADLITFHLETLDNERTINAINKIHSMGKKVGISIKPNTPSSQVLPYVELVDMVLVMTVEPGFGGQSFMHDTMTKVKEIREYAIKNGLNLDIEVDGGINNATIKIAKNAGANIFVLGTAFFKSEKLPVASEIIG